MNLLDIFIILIIGALVMVGFFIGIGRVAAMLLSVYLATIVAAASYQGLSRSIRDGIEGMRTSTSDLVAFLFLFILFSATIYWVITFSFKTVSQRRGRFIMLDNAGGAALAVVVGLLTIAMTLSVTVILLGALTQSSTGRGSDNLGFFERQIDNSQLAPIVLELQPGIRVAFEPWFRNDLPPILQEPPL